MNLLLDTTVLLDALRARRNRRALLAEIIRADGQLYLSTLSTAELFIAVQPHEEAETLRLLACLTQLSVTPPIAQCAGRLKRRHPQLPMADLMLAATALEHDLQFITDTRDRYPVEGLRFYQAPTPTPESLLVR